MRISANEKNAFCVPFCVRAWHDCGLFCAIQVLIEKSAVLLKCFTAYQKKHYPMLLSAAKIKTKRGNKMTITVKTLSACFEQVNNGNYARPQLYAISASGAPGSWTKQFLTEAEAKDTAQRGFIVKATTPHEIP